MLSTLSKRLHTWAKGRVIIAVFIAIVLFMVVTLPLLSLIFPAGSDMTSLDEPVFYTPEEIFSIMESWGDDGRSYQLWFHFTWDLIFPILGFLFVALLISWLLRRGFRPESEAQKLNLLALGTIFDVLENFCLVSLIVFFSARPVVIAWLKTIFTISKYGFGIPILITILIGFVRAAINKFKVQETLETDSQKSGIGQY